MKILLLNWQDPANPRAGGAEIHLFEVFQRLQARGHDVTWLASGWKDAPAEDQLAGIQIRRVAGRYTFGVAAPAFFRRHLAAERWDVVVEALNKVPLYSPAWAGVPVVLLVHHLFGTTAFQEAPFPLAALTWLQERPLKQVYRSTPVQAISRSTANDLLRRGLPADSIEVIHPGVDVDFFHPPSSPTRLPTPTFLYLGRLQKYKRVDLILEAFATVRQRWEHARLIVGGRGGHEGALRRRAAELGLGSAVEFAGYVTEEVKRELFRSAWANVFVSPKEGWGITNLEAAACGTATIASDSPGLRESVVHGRTGMLVPHGNVAALASAMADVAADPHRMEELGRGARAFARELTWERTATLTERHLADSVRTSPPSRS